ncbi:MAG: sugar ABC transporter permease [Petrotogaceae bacterium]|jgi:arabinogalactan oligomer/maltooligosaccharide transport system permease protein|nr:sugar ABC transporter permease [Petrotogaceae bacterium]
MKRIKKKNIWFVRAMAIILVAIILFPFYYVVLTSFKPGSSFYSGSIFPKQFTLDNYSSLINSSKFLLWVKNSTILGGFSALLTVVVTMFGGYAFSRLRFPGRKYGILFLMVLQMFPTSVAMVAYFKMLQIVGLLNTLTGIILIMGLGNAAFGTWIIRNYLNSIPTEIDEAAYIDGASYWQTFWKVLFPLMMPILATQFIMTFIGVYNEYMFSVILLFDPSKYPVGVGIKGFLASNYSVNWTVFCAAAVLGSLPIIFLFLLLQKNITNGLTKGAVKS